MLYIVNTKALIRIVNVVILHLDDVDWQLVKQLSMDGRTSFKALGEAIGFTGLGAKKRYVKLRGNDAIKVVPLVNVEKLNLRLAMIFLETESAEATRRILVRFKDCPRVVNFFLTLGGYNLIALVVAEDQDTLESISMEKCSLRSGEGIRRSEFYPIGTIHYSPFLHIRVNLTHKDRMITPCNVDCQPCPSYQAVQCVGCPTASYYKGQI